MINLPLFTLGQKTKLQKLGVSDPQINELETTALPNMEALLKKSAGKNDVLTLLTDLLKALTKAHKQINKTVLSPAIKTPARNEASQRLIIASYELGSKEKTLEETSACLELAIKVTNNAIAPLRKAPQRYHHSAMSRPIKFIDEALLQGFINQHMNGEMPQYMQTLRQDHTSKRIVEICYAAIRGNQTPERALRNYFNEKSEREDSSNPKKPGRPKKI